MKNTQQEITQYISNSSINFNNPVCKETFNSLPKIYGNNRYLLKKSHPSRKISDPFENRLYYNHSHQSNHEKYVSNGYKVSNFREMYSQKIEEMQENSVKNRRRNLTEMNKILQPISEQTRKNHSRRIHTQSHLIENNKNRNKSKNLIVQTNFTAGIKRRKRTILDETESSHKVNSYYTNMNIVEKQNKIESQLQKLLINKKNIMRGKDTLVNHHSNNIQEVKTKNITTSSSLITNNLQQKSPMSSSAEEKSKKKTKSLKEIKASNIYDEKQQQKNNKQDPKSRKFLTNIQKNEKKVKKLLQIKKKNRHKVKDMESESDSHLSNKKSQISKKFKAESFIKEQEQEYETLQQASTNNKISSSSHKIAAINSSKLKKLTKNIQKPEKNLNLIPIQPDKNSKSITQLATNNKKKYPHLSKKRQLISQNYETDSYRSQTEAEQPSSSKKQLFISSKIFADRHIETSFQKYKKNRQKSRRSSISSSINLKSDNGFKIPTEDRYEQFISKYVSINQQNINKKQKMYVLKEMLLHNSNFKIVRESDGVYFGEVDIKSSQKCGYGVKVTSKAIFEGKYENNNKLQGSQKNADGIYKGPFKNGLRQGYGTFCWYNGESFEGQWKYGKKNGRGKWKAPQGYTYEGEWVDNRQEGKGIFQHRLSRYQGQFMNFLKHGQGEEKFKNKDRYIGQYEKGKPHGQGLYQWKNGAIYLGHFAEGMRQGYGKWTDQNGIIYEGNFQSDLKHGYGCQIYPSGQKFQGQFRLGIKHKGKLISKDGTQVQFIAN